MLDERWNAYLKLWEDMKEDVNYLRQLRSLGMAGSNAGEELRAKFDSALSLAHEVFPRFCDELSQALQRGELASTDLEAILNKLQAYAGDWLSQEERERLIELHAFVIRQHLRDSEEARKKFQTTRKAAYKALDEAVSLHPKGKKVVVKALIHQYKELRRKGDPLALTIQNMAVEFSPWIRLTFITLLVQERITAVWQRFQALVKPPGPWLCRALARVLVVILPFVVGYLVGYGIGANRLPSLIPTWALTPYPIVTPTETLMPSVPTPIETLPPLPTAAPTRTKVPPSPTPTLLPPSTATPTETMVPSTPTLTETVTLSPATTPTGTEVLPSPTLTQTLTPTTTPEVKGDVTSSVELRNPATLGALIWVIIEGLFDKLPLSESKVFVTATLSTPGNPFVFEVSGP
jgi:hypothetical protein